MTHWLCLPPDHRSIHVKAWLLAWLGPPVLWLRAAGPSWGSFLTNPELNTGCHSFPQIPPLPTPSPDCRAPSISFIDLARKFLLLAELPFEKVSLERKHGPRRARWGLFVYLPPGIIIYQLCDLEQVSLTPQRLSFLNCKNENGNICFSGLLGRLVE